MFVFAYWVGNDRSEIAEMIAAWTSEVEAFRIFGDDDVIPLLANWFPEHLALFEAIRITAAKADIARLLLLYYGGLYIDCHCGIRDASEIRRLLAELGATELIFIDRRLSTFPETSRHSFFIE